MRTNAKFKHTNFLRNDRYQAKLNGAKVVARKLAKRGIEIRPVVALKCFIVGVIAYWESWSFKL